MWLSVAIAGGILLALVIVKIGAALIDWLDARTSEITPEEARQRAKLALVGKWPPKPTRRDAIRPVVIVWTLLALVFLGWSYLRMWR